MVIHQSFPGRRYGGTQKGMITKKRLVHYLNSSDSDHLSTASDVMNKNPVTIGPNDDIKYVRFLMIEKVSCIAVVEKNELVGMITEKDVKNVWGKMKRRSNAKN